MSERATTPGKNGNFKTFEDLEVYRAAREFRKTMYALLKRLPEHEKFGLASQIRRAAVSLTNNIAEGHGRYHYLDQIRFTLISRGSLEELMDDLNVCLDEKYLRDEEIASLKAEAQQVLRLMNGYLRFLRDRKLGASLTLQQAAPAYGTQDHEESLEWLNEILESVTPDKKPAYS